jgi:hypothetical protein
MCGIRIGRCDQISFFVMIEFRRRSRKRGHGEDSARVEEKVHLVNVCRRRLPDIGSRAAMLDWGL